jgi:hypothetical protein
MLRSVASTMLEDGAQVQVCKICSVPRWGCLWRAVSSVSSHRGWGEWSFVPAWIWKLSFDASSFTRFIENTLDPLPSSTPRMLSPRRRWSGLATNSSAVSCTLTRVGQKMKAYSSCDILELNEGCSSHVLRTLEGTDCFIQSVWSWTSVRYSIPCNDDLLVGGHTFDSMHGAEQKTSKTCQ